MALPTGGISLDQLNDIRLAVLPKVRKGIQETQQEYALPGFDHLVNGVDEVTLDNYTYGESVRLRMTEGSVVKHEAYAVHGANLTNVMGQATVQVAKRLDKDFVIDLLEKELVDTAGDAEKRFSLFQSRESDRAERVATTIEGEVWNPLSTITETNAIQGPLDWFGKFCDTGGAFAASTTPGYNLIRRRAADGTVSTTFGGIDASTLANQRARAFGWTHNKTVDFRLLSNMALAFTELNYSKINKVTGELKKPQWGVFCHPDLHQMFMDLGNTQGPDDGDSYPRRQARAFGEDLIRVPKLRGDASMPIMAINKAVLRTIKGKGLWMKDIEPFRLGQTSYQMPLLYTLQFFTSNRRHMGWLAHGSF